MVAPSKIVCSTSNCFGKPKFATPTLSTNNERDNEKTQEVLLHRRVALAILISLVLLKELLVHSAIHCKNLYLLATKRETNERIT